MDALATTERSTESSPGDLWPRSRDLQAGLVSDAGCVRDRNEDAGLVWQCLLAQGGQSPLPLGLYMVADGMGGHTMGELASGLAIRLAADYVLRHVCLPLLGDDTEYSERRPIHEVLETSVRLAHQAILRRLPEAGTTLSMVLVMGDGAYLAHVGDSRIYLGEPGQLRPLTKDHSVAARLLEMGQATEEQVVAQRNVLYKALGQGPEIEPDITYHDLDLGQYLLLCCDGLWGEVPDGEIAAIIESAPTPDAACQRLVARAKQNGGNDNITAIVVARGWPLTDPAAAQVEGEWPVPEPPS